MLILAQTTTPVAQRDFMNDLSKSLPPGIDNGIVFIGFLVVCLLFFGICSALIGAWSNKAEQMERQGRGGEMIVWMLVIAALAMLFGPSAIK